jgi:hypothetical protein
VRQPPRAASSARRRRNPPTRNDPRRHVSPGARTALSNRFDRHFTGGGGPAAVQLLGRIVEREALPLTFNDVMLMIAEMVIPVLERPSAAV